VAVLSATALWSKYAGVVHRARMAFDAIVAVETRAALAGFVAVLVGVYVWGLPGLLVATFTAPTATVLLLRRGALPPAALPMEHDERRDTQGFALRLWISGFLVGLLDTLDIVLLGSLRGSSDAQVGYYAFAAMLAVNVDAVA